MPFVLRYSSNDTGAITFTGNTLGLSRSSTPGEPGRLDIIGAFVSVDPNLQYGTYPPGTTADFPLNSAAALLRLPPGSTVLYAELVWGGTYRVVGGANDYEAFINDPVSLTTPLGMTFAVSPDAATAQAIYRNRTYDYLRSADVTAIVQAGGAGGYTAANIVGNIDYGTSTGNCCGWTLCVAYKNMDFPFRNLSLNVGLVSIAASSPPVMTTLSGFATPTSGIVTGRMALCALDGDANKTGDNVLFGPDEANLAALQGPNNFQNNFFASQINNDEGMLDTTGTFGDRNQINGVPGSNIVGGRQGWDITNVDISPTLTNNQTSAVFQLQTSGDGYTVNAVGIYIDINSPRITIIKSVDAAVTEVGHTLTYSLVIENSGTVSAESTLLLDSLPNSTEFLPDSLTVNGTVIPGADPTAGIPLGSIPPGTAVTVSFQAIVIDVPDDGRIVNRANALFQYQSVTGGPVFTGNMLSNEVVVDVINLGIGIIKMATPRTASPGQTVLYEIEVVNTGAIELTGIVVSDPLLGVRTTIASLQPDERVTIPASYTVPPDALAGHVIPNTATAVSDQAGPVDATAEVRVLPVYRLSLGKTVDRRTAVPGETIVYTLTGVNGSNAPVTNVAIADPATGSAQTIPVLNPGETRSIRVSYTVPSGAPAGSRIANVAIVRSDQPPPAQGEAIVTVAPPALEVTKNVSPASAAVGNTITYTLTVRNTTGTPQSAENTGVVVQAVRLFDQLQQQLRLADDSLRINFVAAPDADPAAGIPLGELQPGQFLQVTFRAVVVEAPGSGALSNQAYVTYSIQGSSAVLSASSNVTTFEVMEEEE